MNSFTTAEIHPHTLAALGLGNIAWLRFATTPALRAKGLVEKLPKSRRYRHVHHSSRTHSDGLRGVRRFGRDQAPKISGRKASRPRLLAADKSSQYRFNEFATGFQSINIHENERPI